MRRRSTKARVTIGLMWAPLTFPTGEMAMPAPTAPNKNPVRASRAPGPISGATGPLGEVSMMTADRPTPTSSAVPANSASHSRQAPSG
jgi:hypothetical protein